MPPPTNTYTNSAYNTKFPSHFQLYRMSMSDVGIASGIYVVPSCVTAVNAKHLNDVIKNAKSNAFTGWISCHEFA
jgi:hypothetical protein